MKKYPVLIDPANEHSRVLAFRIFMLCCGLYALHACYAVATQRHLYGDTSWFLVRIMSEGVATNFYGDFWREFYYSRFVAYWLTQGPTVLALHAGIHDARLLSWTLGATYFGYKLISLAICYRLLDKGEKIYIVFPLFALFAGSIISDIYIVTETHIAASFLWPIAILLNRRVSFSGVAKYVGGVAIVVASFTYESWAFFAPMLMLAGFYHARNFAGKQRRDLQLMTALLIVPALINWAAILFPRDPANKSGFIHGSLNILLDTFRGVPAWHVGALASILAISMLALIVASNRVASILPRHKWFLGSLLILLAIGPPLHFLIYNPGVDFGYSVMDRGFGGLAMQFVILSLYIYATHFVRVRFFDVFHVVASVLAAVTIGQVTHQLLSTSAWARAVRAADKTLAKEQGAVSCARIDGQASVAAGITPSEILCSWWATPLSILLAKDGRVQALLISSVAFRAFDPYASEALPHFKYGGIDYLRYLKALRADFDLRPGEHISFTSDSPQAAMLSNGFSAAEKWATWTDSETATFHFCVAAADSLGDLRLTFRLAPLVTSERVKLPVMIASPGGHNTTWDFSSGEPQIVERSISVRPRELPRSGCGDIVFRLPHSLRSPLDMGMSQDPRRLGVAFLDLTITRE
jgi:hypothetical protein